MVFIEIRIPFRRFLSTTFLNLQEDKKNSKLRGICHILNFIQR